MPKNNILIVEDDKDIRDGIGIYLENQNYNIFKAGDGIEGLSVIEENRIDLAIVDIMMPRMDGIMMVLKLREKHNFPVIMLSAKSEDIDKITGLNIGADDYVTKPFVPMELIARVNSCLRRYTKYLNKDESTDTKEKIYTVGGLELNEDKFTFKVDDKPVKLTPTEFKILQLLMSNKGIVFSPEEIYEKISDDSLYFEEESSVSIKNTIMVHVRNIRKKIEINSKNPKYLKVVWGIGYKIENQ